MFRNRAALLAQAPLALALLLLANAAAGRWHFTNIFLNVDYFTLWSVPHALSSKALSGGATPNIYSPDVQTAMGAVLIEEAQSPYASPAQARVTAITSSLYDNRVDATGTPFAYAAVGLLSSGDFERDAWRFQWLSVACFVLAIGVLCRLLRFPAAAAILCLVFLGFGFTPIRSDARVGNINQIQLLALALFIFFSSRGRVLLAGAALGIGIALKPNLMAVAGAVLLFGLADRDYRRVARTALGMLISTLAAVVVGAAYFGRLTLWRDFLGSLGHTLGQGYPLAKGNYGLAELAVSQTNLHLGEAVALLLLVVLAAALFLTRRDSAPEPGDHPWALHQSFLVAGSGCALMLLGSRLVWLHYYSLTIPIALYLLRPPGENDGVLPRAAVIGWGLALCALALLSDGAESMSDPFTESILTNTATLLLFAGCVYSAWSVRKAAEDVVPAASPGRGRKAAVRVRSR
jgi:hypothetical protein